MSRFLPPLRTLLPAEHGAWFMLGFPLGLGLLLRPSLAGLALTLMATALLFARPPLRRLVTGAWDPAQLRALLLLGGVASLGLLLAWRRAGGTFLAPLLAALPLVGMALWADAQRAVRSLWVEGVAQAAFAALGAALVLAGGGDARQAVQAWWLATLLGTANLAHVRHLLGHAHGLQPGPLQSRRWVALGLHIVLVATSAWKLAPQGRAGLVWTLWTLVLALRAGQPPRLQPARRLGWREGGLSLAGLLLLAWALRA